MLGEPSREQIYAHHHYTCLPPHLLTTRLHRPVPIQCSAHLLEPAFPLTHMYPRHASTTASFTLLSALPQQMEAHPLLLDHLAPNYTGCVPR